jgi:hypothetical protein
MRIEELYSYISKNLDNIEKSGIKITKEETSWGDRYHNETGMEFRFRIFEDDYIVGWVSICEDADDWAQAEAYTCDICRKNERNISADIVYDLVVNYQSIVRERKLNSIMS